MKLICRYAHWITHKKGFRHGPKTWTVTWFAHQLNCDRRNIYNIFARQSIDTVLLMRISKILQHNFFEDLAAESQEDNSETKEEDIS